jgi:hypothetical protein
METNETGFDMGKEEVLTLSELTDENVALRTSTIGDIFDLHSKSDIVSQNLNFTNINETQAEQLNQSKLQIEAERDFLSDGTVVKDEPERQKSPDPIKAVKELVKKSITCKPILQKVLPKKKQKSKLNKTYNRDEYDDADSQYDKYYDS